MGLTCYSQQADRGWVGPGAFMSLPFVLDRGLGMHPARLCCQTPSTVARMRNQSDDDP